MDQARLEDGTSLELPPSSVTMRKEGTRFTSGSASVRDSPKSISSILGPNLIPHRAAGPWGTGKSGSGGWKAVNTAGSVMTQVLLAHDRGVVTPPWQETLPLPSLPSPSQASTGDPDASTPPSDFDLPAGKIFEARF